MNCYKITITNVEDVQPAASPTEYLISAPDRDGAVVRLGQLLAGQRDPHLATRTWQSDLAEDRC